MFVIFGNYTAPIEAVDSHRDEHLRFIGGLVDDGRVVVVGRRAAADGSVVIVSAENGDAALALFSDDPYVKASVVEYEIAAEFAAAAKAPGLADYS